MLNFFSTITNKILIGYISILLATVVTAMLLVNFNSKIEGQARNFVEVTLPQLQELKKVSSASKSILISAYSLYGTTISVEEYDKAFKQFKSETSASISILSDSNTIDNQLLMTIKIVEGSLHAVRNIMAAKRVDWDAARKELNRLSSEAGKFARLLRDYEQKVGLTAEENSQNMIDSLSSMLGLIFVLILVTVIVSLAAYLFARRHVALPIERLSHTLIEVAETRDLTISLPVSSRDEIGQSANNVNLLLNNFHQSISEVSNVISGITESVSDLGQSSDEADKVVNELAETIDMLIDAIQQLESQILHSSSVSESAANTAEMGAEQVNDGAREVEQTSESIGKLASDLETTAEMLMELRSSGDQVSSVVGSIAEIADQTNLLALNAAIEAARAGESGRGFAVVADEVRSLANKTQQSTVEINDILDKIVSAINQSLDTMAQNQRQAQNSVNLAQNTVESLASIRNTIMQLSGECHEVSSLSSAAQNEMNQAAKAVNDFKSMGSRVSISSNDVQLAATNLTELAESLSQQALRFKL